MDTTIERIKEGLPVLKVDYKNAATKLNTLRSAPTTSQLAAMVDSLRAENKMKKEKLIGFTTGSVKMLTKDEMEKVEKDFKYWGMKRKARKGAYANLEYQLLEGGITKDDIEDKVGVEPDTYDL